MAVNYDKPIVTATLADLRELVVAVLTDLNAQPTKPTPPQQKNLVYGLAGIAKIFGCSQSTAERIKAEGTIDGAISQVGDCIVVDVDKALELSSVEAKKRAEFGKRNRYTYQKMVSKK